MITPRKSPLPDLTLPLLSLTDGLLFVLIAIFAHTLGPDPDAAWGRTRFTLLAIGIILLVASLLMFGLIDRKVPPFGPILKSEAASTITALCHLWIFIFLAYAWFITYGTFTKWDHTSNYYAQLANAFNAGRTYLDVKPGEAILATADPYDPKDRPRQEDIWDMSLYKGRIYLYWGPLPAVLIAPIQRFLDVKVLDIFINFFYYAGLVIVNSMILLKLWKNFFPGISVQNVFVCILLIGLIAPILWALIPSTIYGTAIGAGHFFLMGGLYFALSAFEGKPEPDWRLLFLAGLFWACSVGSRALNAPSIAFLSLLTAIWIAKMTPRPFSWARYAQATVPFFLPLIIGAVATGWYNWVRFDSPFEFGLRYQITFFNLRRDMGLTFQPDYFPLNLYVYLLQPFRLTGRFPFAIPVYTPDVLDLHHLVPPKMFFAGRMTGLLFGAPFLLLALVHLFLKKVATVGERADGRDPNYDFLMYSLAGSFLIGFLGLMFFFFGQMRYLVDVISQITILAILGYWRLISIGQETKSIASKVPVTASHLLLAFTICISLLLAVTSETSRMQKNNPQLLEKIADALSFEK